MTNTSAKGVLKKKFQTYFDKLFLIVKLINQIRGSRKSLPGNNYEFCVAKNAPQQVDNYSCSVFCAAYFLMFLEETGYLSLNIVQFRESIKNLIADEEVAEYKPERKRLPSGLQEARNLQCEQVSLKEIKTIEFLNIFV